MVAVTVQSHPIQFLNHGMVSVTWSDLNRRTLISCRVGFGCHDRSARKRLLDAQVTRSPWSIGRMPEALKGFSFVLGCFFGPPAFLDT